MGVYRESNKGTDLKKKREKERKGKKVHTQVSHSGPLPPSLFIVIPGIHLHLIFRLKNVICQMYILCYTKNIPSAIVCYCRLVTNDHK